MFLKSLQKCLRILKKFPLGFFHFCYREENYDSHETEAGKEKKFSLIFPELIILFSRKFEGCRKKNTFRWYAKLRQITIIFPSVVNAIIESRMNRKIYILMNYKQQMRTENFEWDLLNNKLTKNIPQKITCENLLSFSLLPKIFQFFSIIFIVRNYFFFVVLAWI